MDDCTPMPITRLSISRSLWTSGVKSESPVPIANVVMKLRSYASSIASTAILMSAAFLREPPSRCGISMSSTWARAMQPSVLVERRPVGVRPARHHPAALGQRVGDRAEVERAHPEAVAGADREVLVVEEQRDALVVGDHGGQRDTFPPVRRIP